MKPVSYISGATGYAGSKITEHLASQGKDLLVSARDEKKLHDLVADLSNRYPNQNFRAFTCDLATPESWKSAIEVLNDFTVLQYINCSGIQGQLGPSSELNYEDMKDVFNVNLFSGIFFTNHLARKIRECDKLSVIHFSGGGSTSPRPLFMSYSLSKTSLLRFVENFAAENMNENIKVNAIAPGVLPSKMQSEIIGNERLHDSKDYAISLKSLSEENYDATKLLSLCDFLLTDRSDGISGKLISAEWDNWAEWPNYIDQIKNSDLYTLRRITGRDRDLVWGDL
jgi:3-oxoacyl-[acyl-carrier protein] reductase